MYYAIVYSLKWELIGKGVSTINRWKHVTAVSLGLLMGLLLTGCMFKASFEDLYEVPQLPSEYTELRNQIEMILNDGAEYATPMSGTNIQSVQLIDLDGDGMEEALAFFRKANDEKPLKIYIFKAVDNTYEQAAMIESGGTAIHSVYYVDMDGDGFREIIVGWRVSTEVKAVGVYSIRDFEPELLMDGLMDGLYAQYEVLDFDGDGTQEMVLLRSDTNNEPVADYYDWEDKQLKVHSTARLSMTMAELSRVDVGTLQDGETALFVTGVAEDTRAITDILTYTKDGIVNIVRDNVTGVTSEIFRYISLNPTDIDGDGVTEVPMPVVLSSSSELDSETYWQVIWRSFNAKGQREIVLSTYHNISDGWYLILPDEWDGEIAVRQVYGSEEQGTIFSAKSNGGTYRDVLGIYTITGNSREYKATRNGRFVLKQQVDTIYAAALLEGNEGWAYAIDQEEVNQRFRLIVREWTAGEN